MKILNNKNLLIDINIVKTQIKYFNVLEDKNKNLLLKDLKKNLSLVPYELEIKFNSNQELINSFYNKIDNNYSINTKTINIDIPDNELFVYYFSIFNNIDSIIELLILDKDLKMDEYEYLLNHKELQNIKSYYKNIYNKIINEVVDIYVFENDKEKEETFNKICTFLDIDAKLKNDKEYILKKYLDFTNKYNNEEFIKEMNNIDNKNNKYLFNLEKIKI